MDIELPPLEDGQALVEIHYTSVCGSQLNEIYGRKGEDRFLPHLLGHEAIGIIREVKDERMRLKSGQTVICTWLGNGMDKNICPKGIVESNSSRTINGGPITTFSTHSIISTNKLIKLDETKPIPEHALLGCAIPTGAGSVKYCTGKDMAIVGLGGVGLAAALEAKYHDISVMGIDTNEFKRQYAALNHIQVSASIGIHQMWDFIFESSGNKLAMESAFAALQSKGTLVLAGNLPKGQKIEIDPFRFISHRIKILGTVGGDCTHEDIISFIPRIKTFSPLISKEYGFKELDLAIKDLAEGRIIKPIIRCFNG